MKGDKRRYKNLQLLELAEAQTPSPQYKAAGRIIYDAIFESLRQHPKVNVDRCRVGGSVGKGSALGDEFSPDFDLVVFINPEKGEPPFSKKTLAYFDEAVKNAKVPPRCRITLMNGTPFSVQAEANVNGIQIHLDVLPAVNLTADADITNAMAKVKIQETAVRKKIKKNKPGKTNYLSSSLAEATVSFINEKPRGISRIIRIAKYWDRHVDLGDGVKLKGRSFLIELVATRVNIDRPCSRGLQARFSRFLVQMANLSTANIQFDDNYPLNAIPSNVLSQTRKLSDGRIVQVPIIMDPINPTNNLGQQFAKPGMELVLQKYKMKALETLRRIKACKNNDQYLDINTWFN